MSIPPKRRKPPNEAAGDARKRQTMQRLMDAAERLIEEHGYENTSVTEVAAVAGVVPSLINAYFRGKGGLLYAVANRHNQAQLDATRQAGAMACAPSLRLGKIIATWAEQDLSRRNLVAALNALSWTWPAETEAEYRRDLVPFAEVVRAVYADGVAAGEFRASFDDDIFEAVLGVYLWGIRPGIFAADAPDACAARITHRLLRLFAPVDTRPA